MDRSLRLFRLFSLLLGGLFPLVAQAGTAPAGDSPDRLQTVFGGFVDTYYLYDFNSPSGVDRSLTNGSTFATTGERSNEFNVNLAYLEAKASSDRVHGRVALQAGTSVQANYQAESNGLGVIKGPLPAELLQEAYAGYRPADGLWVDGGIFFSHLGFESFISRDNWTYTRSLVAEFSPYYESGVRVVYQPDPEWTAMALVLNGWQNIYDIDQGKAVGFKLSYAGPGGRFEVSYSDYLGAQPGGLLRFFNDGYFRFSLSQRLQLALIADEGSQARPGGLGTSFWYGGSLLMQWKVSSRVALAGRVERFFDRDGVIVPTGSANGFAVSGVSVNADFQLHPSLVWRNEARVLVSDRDAIFAGDGGPAVSDPFLVSSLGLSF